MTEYVTIIKNIHINRVNFLDLLTWMIKHALRLLCIEYTYKILREDSRNSIALSRLELLQHGWSEVENCPVAMQNLKFVLEFMDNDYIPARDKGDYTSCYECTFQKLLPGIVWGCTQYGKLNISESIIHDGGETYAVIKSI